MAPDAGTGPRRPCQHRARPLCQPPAGQAQGLTSSRLLAPKRSQPGAPEVTGRKSAQAERRSYPNRPAEVHGRSSGLGISFNKPSAVAFQAGAGREQRRAPRHTSSSLREGRREVTRPEACVAWGASCTSTCCSSRCPPWGLASQDRAKRASSPASPLSFWLLNLNYHPCVLLPWLCGVTCCPEEILPHAGTRKPPRSEVVPSSP